jgi:hypothetical protein
VQGTRLDKIAIQIIAKIGQFGWLPAERRHPAAAVHRLPDSPDGLPALAMVY